MDQINPDWFKKCNSNSKIRVNTSFQHEEKTRIPLNRNYSLIDNEIKRVNKNLIAVFSILFFLSLYFFYNHNYNFVTISFSLFTFISLIHYYKLNTNAVFHPINNFLSSFDSPDKVKEDIDEEIRCPRSFVDRKIIITNNWLIILNIFSVKIYPIHNYFWIYGHITSHRKYFIEVNRTHQLVLVKTNGTMDAIQIGEQDVDKIINELKKIHPWIIAGYSDELKKLCSKDISSLINFTEYKKNEYNKLVKYKNTNSTVISPRFSSAHLRFFGSLAIALLISLGLNSTTQTNNNISNSDISKEEISSQFKEFTQKIKLSDEAINIFNHSNPVMIFDKNELNNLCGKSHYVGLKNQYLLGCYTGKNIYILDSNSDNFPGMVESVTSHELLHAIYNNLNSDYRMKINVLLQEEFSKISNPRLIETLKSYNEKELLSELHSRFGTEIQTLSPELEEHYSKYFSDRKLIVKYYLESTKILSHSDSKINSLNNKLNECNNLLKRYKENVDEKLSTLTRIKTEIQNLNYQYDSNEYNELVDQYNESLKDFEKERIIYNKLVLMQHNLVFQIKESVNKTNFKLNEAFAPTGTLEQEM